MSHCSTPFKCPSTPPLPSDHSALSRLSWSKSWSATVMHGAWPNLTLYIRAHTYTCGAYVFVFKLQFHVGARQQNARSYGMAQLYQQANSISFVFVLRGSRPQKSVKITNNGQQCPKVPLIVQLVISYRVVLKEQILIVKYPHAIWKHKIEMVILNELGIPLCIM